MIVSKLALQTHLIEEMDRFYYWLPRGDGGPRLLHILMGYTTLELSESEEPVPPVHFAIDVAVSQFEEIAAWADSTYGLVTGKEDGRKRFRFESWRAHACYVRDPAGNLLELIAREEREHRQRFVGVTEVGLAVDDVAGTVASLGEIGMSPYGSTGQDFAAVGDPDGLFIVVSEGRLWYPDNVTPARKTPLKVEFWQSRNLYRLTGPPYRVAHAAQ